MPSYRVEWCEITRVVQAEDEGEAWAKFADAQMSAGNYEPQKNPKLYERTITEVKENDSNSNSHEAGKPSPEGLGGLGSARTEQGEDSREDQGQSGSDAEVSG